MFVCAPWTYGGKHPISWIELYTVVSFIVGSRHGLDQTLVLCKNSGATNQ